MAQVQYPTTEQLAAAAAIQTPFVTGKLKLIKATIALTPGMVAADLTAIECDFTGYVAKTLTALPAPYPDLVRGGVSWTQPTQTFAVGATPTVFNDVFGGWMEDSGGLLLQAFLFNAAIPMQAVGDALALELSPNFFGPGNLIATVNGQQQ